MAVIHADYVCDSVSSLIVICRDCTRQDEKIIVNVNGCRKQLLIPNSLLTPANGSDKSTPMNMSMHAVSGSTLPAFYLLPLREWWGMKEHRLSTRCCGTMLGARYLFEYSFPHPFLYSEVQVVSLSKQMHVHSWMHANHLDSRVGLSFNVNLVPPCFLYLLLKSSNSFILHSHTLYDMLESCIYI